MQRKLGNIAPSKLSYHLKELRQAELVEEHRLGKRVCYTANLAALTRLLAEVRQRFLLPYLLLSILKKRSVTER